MKTSPCRKEIRFTAAKSWPAWMPNTAIATVSAGVVTAVGPGAVSMDAYDGYFPDYFHACYGSDTDLVCPMVQGVDASAGGTITNNTPMITGIYPSDWTSGTTTLGVTFTGQYFGTNAPTLSFSPSNGISYGLVSYSDTQVVANINVATGTPNEQVTVTITNNGYGGLGFQSGGGRVSPTSAPVSASVHAPLNSPEIVVGTVAQLIIGAFVV